jgi:hypothetical protein
MALILAFVFIAAAAAAFVVLITIVVVLGVRQDERSQTLMRRSSPNATAQLARIVLGRYVRKSGEHVGRDGPDNRTEPERGLARVEEAKADLL